MHIEGSQQLRDGGDNAAGIYSVYCVYMYKDISK